MKTFYSTKDHKRGRISGVRPGFRAGASIVGIHAQELRPNFRNGVGNSTITRPNFMASKIMPRQHTDFDKLQAMDIANQGEKVRLSDETLERILTVNVPDPTDLRWIAERNRLEALYAARGMTAEQISREMTVNKPLGRQQRTIKQNRDQVDQATLTMGRKLEELQQEVKDGRAESRLQQAQIIGQFALVLADTNAIAGLTILQLTNLGRALARIGVPTNHKRLGLIPRFVDVAYYNQNAGLINLLLFSKVRESPNTAQFNYDLMVKNYAGNAENGLPAISLRSMISALGRPAQRRRYLDLLRGGVVSRRQLRAVSRVTQNGFDGPDFDIQLANQ
jgi:hypothetical protein